MNNTKTIGLICLAALTGLGYSSLTYAEWDYEDNYHALYGYEDELENCVDILRPSLAGVDTDRVTYVVEKIYLHGPWYRFEIEASTYDSTGQRQLHNFRVACKSNRWIEKARLMERPNPNYADQVLLVHDTHEINVNQVVAINTGN